MVTTCLFLAFQFIHRVQWRTLNLRKKIVNTHKLEIELGLYQNLYQQMNVYIDNVTQRALRMNIILCLNVKNMMRNALFLL